MVTPGSEDILEVEWQFDAPDIERVARWLETAAVPGFTLRATKNKDVTDTYFDTPGWRIHRGRFTCRLREKGDGAEITMKAMAEASGGMRRRRELTELVPPEAASQPDAASGPCGQALRVLIGREPLAPLFSLRQHRRTFELADVAGVLGEISLDETTIPVGESPPVRFSRVEVEVDANAVVRARRFVDVLIVATGLAPATKSKFEKGLEAAELAPSPSAPPLGGTVIAPAMTAGDVALAVLRRQFAVFLNNEQGTRLGEDIEALHDMRVAARRMRAAMNAFRAFLPPRFEAMRLELGWVAAALGVVRDLDVQMERMEEWRVHADDPHALDAIEALLHGRRVRGRARMLLALNSRRYERFVERYTALLQRGVPRPFVAARTPILAAAPDLLERRYRALRRPGDRVTPASPAADYHALRIEAKKLRYALEFVGPIYGKPATDFSVRVTALQDVLGQHQDAEVAIETLRHMAATSRPRLQPATVLAMGAIAERYRVQAAELRAAFPKVYGPLAGAEWRKLRRLIEAQRPKETPAI
ncbi:MAG: CHAD domain-containing protein [Chloroflexi bacterium]|nr:CHAD domain-containing protein [Chloroflexota bacterium]